MAKAQPKPDGVEEEAKSLAALIDEADADLRANGPVSPADLANALAVLEDEWNSDQQRPTSPAR